MIAVKDVCVSFESKEILKDVSFEISSNEKVALSGESGSGKTTLLKVLIGMIAPPVGSVQIADLNLTPEKIHDIRSKMFYLPQEIVPYGDETVWEFLKHPFSFAVCKHKSFSNDKAIAMFEEFRLNRDIGNQHLSSISGGERKRIGIIRGLLLERPIMLLDEPTTGIDPKNREMVAKKLNGLENTTVFAISHDDDYNTYAQRCLMMHEINKIKLKGEN